ncbi:MAG: MFS transporter [Azospirillaceae bacterium]
MTVADIAGRPVARTAFRIFLPFALGYLVSYVFRTVNAVIADDLAAAVGTDAAGLGLLTSAYFVAFAAFQIPLGLLLDRYGPRRVEAGLLVVAAAGALAFSLADSLAGLTAARALIGLGVSACLMAAFKNAVLWWPRDRLPLVNGLILACGGLGAVAATTPVAALLELTDWRGVFRLLAGLTVLAAAYIWLAVPEPTGDGTRPARLREQVAGLGAIFASRFFWRLAPLTVMIQAGHMAYQGLWTAPWLAEVDGLDRTAVADILQSMGIAMILGYSAVGLLAERLSRAGIRPLTVSIAFAALFCLNAAAIALPGAFGVGTAPAVQWPVFVFLSTASILGYTVLSQSFPAAMAGRANTALNLLAFTAAFAAQAGLGVVIGLVPGAAGTAGDPAGHRIALGLMVLLTVAAWLWAVRPGAPRGPETAP